MHNILQSQAIFKLIKKNQQKIMEKQENEKNFT